MQVKTDEEGRLAELLSYEIVDTPEEETFDEITKLAAYICGTPMSMVTFIDNDRQWIKSAFGSDVKETHRNVAFCAYALHQSDIMVVADPVNDKRFANNPLVTTDPHIRFYAGAPLVTQNGYGLGTLCVVDTRQRELTDAQTNALDALRNLVVKELEYKKSINSFKSLLNDHNASVARLKQLQIDIDQKNDKLSEFSRMLTDDIKSPIRGIVSLVTWIQEDYGTQLSQELKANVNLIKDHALKLNNLIDSLTTSAIKASK